MCFRNAYRVNGFRPSSENRAWFDELESPREHALHRSDWACSGTVSCDKYCGAVTVSIGF